MASSPPAANGEGDGVSPRRRVLMLGAAAASTVVTIRPALAQTATSVLNCRIPIPDPPNAGKHIMRDGSLVAPETAGSFAPAPRPATGAEVKAMIDGATPPGFDPAARQAYVRYVRRLQRGTSGFTCYASLQAPR